jgi:hypothetical protein
VGVAHALPTGVGYGRWVNSSELQGGSGANEPPNTPTAVVVASSGVSAGAVALQVADDPNTALTADLLGQYGTATPAPTNLVAGQAVTLTTTAKGEYSRVIVTTPIVGGEAVAVHIR